MKPFWHSKMFWTNAFAAAAIVGQAFTGQQVLADPATQATALAVVNIALRFVTRDAVSLGRS